jgi:hypothetical protein
MQYAVPQFIDSEDKLIGPFSLKQFGIVFAVGIIDVIIFKLFGVGVVLIVFGVPIAIAGLGIAFIPFNGRQVYQMFPMFISFFTKPRVYIFRHTAPSIASMHLRKDVKPTSVAAAAASLESPQSALKRLSMSLDQKHDDDQTDLIASPYAAYRSPSNAK